MPVRIIKDDEKLVYRCGDTTFYYKRIKSESASAIRRRHTNRGIIDHAKVGMEILSKYLVGWENVQDWDGGKITFDVNLIPELPDEVLAELIGAIGSAEGEYASMEEASAKLKKDEIEKN